MARFKYYNESTKKWEYADLAQGAQGPIGPQGPAGPAGPEGPQGPPGKSTIVQGGKTITAEAIDGGYHLYIPDGGIGAGELAANSVGTSELQSGSVNSAIIATNAVGWGEFNTGDIMPKITSGRYTSGTADAQIPTSWSNEIRIDIPSEGTYVIFGTVSVNAMGGQNATVYISMDISGKSYEEFVSGGWARHGPFMFVEHATAGAHYVQLKRGGGTVAITYSYKRTSVAAIRIA